MDTSTIIRSRTSKASSLSPASPLPAALFRRGCLIELLPILSVNQERACPAIPASGKYGSLWQSPEGPGLFIEPDFSGKRKSKESIALIKGSDCTDRVGAKTGERQSCEGDGMSHRTFSA
jgi:hypothetical protein